jgi:RHS repeat-associated protein
VDTINGQPGGRNDYTYDPLNRVTQLTQGGTGVSPKLVQFSYNEVGQLATIARFADLVATQLVARSTYDYDGAGRLVSLAHATSTATLASYTFGYDAVGQITHRTDPDGVATFTYDKTGQITSVIDTDPRDPSRTYAWNANGNPTGGGRTIGPSNRLLADANFTYTYDNEGNLITRTDRATGAVRTFEWDYHNQLAKVTDRNAAGTPTQVVRYVYDALGRRIAKAVDPTPLDATDAVVTHFVYDRSDVLLEFLDDDGSGPDAPVLSMRYLDGPAIDQVLAQENYREPEASLRVLWLLPDQLGSTRDLVDSTGTVRDHITYDPFGRVLFQSNPAVTTRYLFTGREFDREMGLYYYRARYFDPATGRFLSEDPERFNRGDLSWYRYVGNDPLRGLDPSGRFHEISGAGLVIVGITTFGILPLGEKLGEDSFVHEQLRDLHRLRQEAYLVFADAKRSNVSDEDLKRDAFQLASIDGEANHILTIAEVNKLPDLDTAARPIVKEIDGLLSQVEGIRDYRKQHSEPKIDVCNGGSTGSPLADILLTFFQCNTNARGEHSSSVEWLFLAALGLFAAAHFLEQLRRRRRLRNDQADLAAEDPDEETPGDEPLAEPRDQAVRLRPPGYSGLPGRAGR